MSTLHANGYNLFIGSTWQPLNEFVLSNDYASVAVFVDENTRQWCLPAFRRHASFEVVLIEMPAGEKHKNLDTCRHVWGEMMRLGLERRSLLVNLGGGVVGDLGGFCAATWLRGIDFVQMPTTLLAQVDASIGGKVGVDFQFVKNAIGVFENPKAVFIEPAFLSTLPFRELRSGFAEIIKHALIADAPAWEKLQTLHHLEELDWTDLILSSLKTKLRIVSADPLEQGLRKMLNFGHTIGHALESFFLQSARPLLHGEAVVLGILCESWLSHRVSGLPPTDLAAIEVFLQRFYDPCRLATNDFSHLLEFMKLDKKNEKGRINFTLLSSIGTAQVNQTCPEDLIRESLYRYCRG